VLIGAYAPDGRRETSQRLNAKVRLRPIPGTLVAYEVLSQLRLKPGRYQLRFAAESALQKRSGSVYFDVDVPDFSKGELTMSGIALNATPNVPVAPADAFANLIPIVPTARREFWKDDRVTAFLRVYQSRKQLAPVLLTARIRNSADATVFERTDPIGAQEIGKDWYGDYRVELPIGTLERGRYVLTLEAAVEGHSARQDVRFVMQ
jgi:hypothetical protein